MGKKIEALTKKSKAELFTELANAKSELSQLRVAQVTNGAASKLGRIVHVRKQIARVWTVLNTRTKNDMKKQIAGKRYKPKELRAKLTRAKRRALTTKQKGLKTEKQQKKEANFPIKRYAVKA